MDTAIMSENDMLEQIMKDVRQMRAQQAEHIRDVTQRFTDMAEDITRMRVKTAWQRGKVDAKLAAITAGIAIVSASIATWVVNRFGA